jgi:hypothetical protein
VGSEVIFEKAKVDPKLRPQDISVLKWCKLGNAYEEWLKVNPNEMKRFRDMVNSKQDTPDMLAMAKRLLEDLDHNKL